MVLIFCRMQDFCKNNSVDSVANGLEFTRYVIEEGLDRPHGDWAGDVQGNNPRWVNDVFGTIGMSSQAVWYENAGLGTLWGPRNVIYTSDRYCMEIAAGDLDNDGDIDAVSNHSSLDSLGTSFLAIHRNNGNGTFTTTTLPSLQTGIRQIRIVDINGDGLRDIVIACDAFYFDWQSGTGVYWYRNNGGMNFTQNYVGGRCNAWKVYCIDFNGDNHKEIVVTEAYWGENENLPCRVILFRNNGAESFTPQIIDPNADPADGSAAGVICADFDKDGDIDIISGGLSNGEIYGYRNIGYPNFSKYTIDGDASELDGIDMCDFDVDGDMDFVAAGRNYWIAWYENLAPASPGNFYKHIFDTEWRYFDLPYTTYLDGDSCCDLIVSIDGYSNDGRFVVYLSPCSTAAVEEKEYTYGTNWMKVPTIISSDFAKIEYSIQDRGDIKLDVIDIAGRTLQVIEQKYCNQPGVYRTVWNINKKPNGIYFVRLKSNNISPIVRKVTVIRNR
ncbi:MAG: VCBS repeat-containing protein [Candidatus Stahlbacteria bacterium]|nr:VCBS repeat-containing protein [Candidatus Stahlbacteria bacterium]